MQEASAAPISIAGALADVRRRGRPVLVPFIPGGYPSIQATRQTIAALETAGASVIEIGFPFTDPIADGPVIQAAFTAALAKGIRANDVLRVLTQKHRPAVPRVAMVSYSIVFRYGVDRFVKAAKSAGVAGLILPDLPPPEAEAVCERVRAGGLDTILMIAPTTSPHRRKEIVRLCSGFVYYLSVSGITGERDRLPADLAENVKSLRELTDLPICVGFGISTAAHIKQLAGIADGAIVGTAMVRRMTAANDLDPDSVAEAAGNFCRELLKD